MCETQNGFLACLNDFLSDLKFQVKTIDYQSSKRKQSYGAICNAYGERYNYNVHPKIMIGCSKLKMSCAHDKNVANQLSFVNAT